MMGATRLGSKKYNSTARIAALIILIIVAAQSASAQMREASEEELSHISAQAGISINIGDSGMKIDATSIRYSDTGNVLKNWVEFNNFSISGPDGYFKLDCPEDYPNMLDVVSHTTIDNQALTFVQYQLSDHTSPRTYNVGNFVFCNQDLGSITFDTSTVEPAIYRISSHPGVGTSGIEFEYLTKWRTQDFTYMYSTAATGNSLRVSGLNIAGTVSGDPSSDPATWVYNGTFQFGDLYGGVIDVDSDPLNAASPNPATIDVATIDTNTSVYLNIPMKGSIRAANVNLGGAEFGPIAIDGITAHRFGVRFNPGN